MEHNGQDSVSDVGPALLEGAQRLGVASSSIDATELEGPAAELEGPTAPLRQLIEPMKLTTFLQEYWGKRFAHVVGPPGRFTHLFPWSQLNNVLEHHRLDSPRLRLFQAGRQLDARTYHRASVLPGNGVILKAAELVAHLRGGATLVIEEVEDTFRPLRDLIVDLEQVFKVNVHCNVYAGWRTDEGFSIHWDPHDTFILQLYGRKRWRVWDATRKHPVYGETDVSAKPSGNPLLDTELEDGSVLYLPRGWWHVAQPVNEATLHLTVSVNNRNGLDLLTWLAKTLRTSEFFRQDLPSMAIGTESRTRAEHLKHELLKAWTPDILDRFFADLEVRRAVRPRFNLPECISEASTG